MIMDDCNALERNQIQMVKFEQCFSHTVFNIQESHKTKKSQFSTVQHVLLMCLFLLPGF